MTNCPLAECRQPVALTAPMCPCNLHLLPFFLPPILLEYLLFFQFCHSQLELLLLPSFLPIRVQLCLLQLRLVIPLLKSPPRYRHRLLLFWFLQKRRRPRSQVPLHWVTAPEAAALVRIFLLPGLLRLA